jgi:hypothetical protein
MKATCKLAKTGRIDAQILARFAGAVGPKVSGIPSKEARAWQASPNFATEYTSIILANSKLNRMALRTV